MFRKVAAGALAAMALAVLAVPAQAQNSDSYKFLKAVKEGDGEAIDTLLANPSSGLLGAKDRSTGDSALHIVTRQRNLDWLQFFVGKGARMDQQNDEGSTPLALAAQLGWAEGAEFLLKKKAKVDLANSRGETPLILAVQKRDFAMVRLLLSKGADPHQTDRVAGYSALDYAKRDRRSAMIVKALEATMPMLKASGIPGLVQPR